MSRPKRPFISVIIPTRNNSGTLAPLLTSLHGQGYRDLEILVVDNASTDDTRAIAEGAGARVFLQGPERSAQRNRGAREARGDLLLFLDSDMEATPGLLQEVAERASQADGLCLREIITGSDYWTRVRAFERARYFRSDLFEAARAFWRDVFDRLGGYDPALTGQEDYDLHARFLEAGYRLGWADRPLLHHEEAIGFFQYLRKRGYYGRTDSLYASKHPDRWRRQRSAVLRIRFLLDGGLDPAAVPLLWGWLALRGLERAVRRFPGSR